MIKNYPIKNPFRTYLALQKDPIPFLADVVNECGDFARIRVFPFHFLFINDPGLIHEALVEKSDVLIIKGGASGGLSRLIGHGILTNHGNEWRESRRGLQPLFNQDALKTYEAVVEARVQESLSRWTSRFSGESFSLNREMLALSFRITCSALFKYLPTFEEAEEFADAVWILQSDGMRRYVSGLDLFSWIPLPLNRKVNHAVQTLRRLARKTIEAGATQPLDEILSILFAGTESPANTVCWALVLLQRNPQWQERGFDSESISQLISETMRLYPAGWASERFATQDMTLGGQTIQKGARILFSPYFLHRHKRFWKNSETFDPNRFSGASPTAAPADVPKYAYLPFGAGPRSCIGSRMAWLEMRMTLGAILRQCRWSIESPLDATSPAALGSFKIRFDRPISIRMDSIHTPEQTPTPI